MNIEKQVLTIEQARYLQKLGLNMSDAAHFWCSKKLDTRGNDVKRRDWFITLDKAQMHCGMMVFEYIPTYTLQEVLDKLPKYIKDVPKDLYTLDVDLGDRALISYDGGCSVLRCYEIVEGNVLETAYYMLCWVLENGYLKEEKK